MTDMAPPNSPQSHDAASGHGSTVFQWLIERGQPEGEPEAVWLENSAAHPASHRRWTDDARAAAMFPTKEAAESYITEEVLAARAVEHGFMTQPTMREVALADLEYVLRWLRQSEAPENIIRLQERGLDTIVGREVEPHA